MSASYSVFLFSTLTMSSSLYYGRNSGGTHVFTAVTRNGEDVLSFDEDFYPLFEYILEQAHKHIDTPNDLPKDPWLGIVEFGTETWLSDGNVTFTAADFSMELNGPVRNRTKTNSSDDDSTGGDDNSTDGNDKNSSDDEEDHASTLSRSMLSYALSAILMIRAFCV